MTDILTIAPCAVIDGADTWEEIAECRRTKEAFHRRPLVLPHGVSSPASLARVFVKLAPGPSPAR